MRPDVNKWQMYHLFFQDEVVAYEIQENIQQGIATPASQVAERLLGNNSTEWFMEEVNNVEYESAYHIKKSRKVKRFPFLWKHFNLFNINIELS